MQILPRQFLLVTLGAALLLRIVVAVGLTVVLEQRGEPFLIAGDANGYWELGQKIAANKEYAIHTPPRYVLRMPGFPAFLAVIISIVGDSLLAARLALAIVGTLACAAVFWLGQILTDERTAKLACLLVSFSPLLVGFSPVLLSETLFAFAVCLSLIPLAQLWNHFEKANAFWLATMGGTVIAFGTYVRPSWLLFAPLFGMAFVLSADQRLKAAFYGLLVCGVCVLCLVPWGLRNHNVTGHFVLTTMWAGPSLYDGLNDRATGASDMRFFDSEQASLTMTEYEVDQHYRQRAFSFIRNNPRRVLELAIVKLGRFYSFTPASSQFQVWWQKALCLPGSVIVLIGGIIGAYCRRNDWRLLYFTLGPLLYFTTLHMLFVGSMRYRLPVEYPLSILSAAGCLHVADWLKKPKAEHSAVT